MHEKWNSRRQALFLDGLTAETAFLLLIYSAGSFAGIQPFLIWTFCALALSVLMLMACRMADSGSGSALAVFLFAALCFCACVSGRAFRALSVRIAGMVMYISAIAAGLIRAAGYTLHVFLTRLLSLFPLPQEEIVLQEAQQQSAELPELFPDVQVPDMRAPVILLCLLTAAVCFRVWKKYRGRRWQTISGGMIQDPGIKKERKRGRLQKRIVHLADYMAFHIRYMLNRNTPEGLLTFTENHMAGSENRRKRAESAPEFLRRISLILDADGAHFANTLADVLENMYYNNKEGNLPGRFAGAYRRSVRRA